MTGLFYSFDGFRIFFSLLRWTIIFNFILFPFISFWLKTNQITFFWSLIIMFLKKEFIPLLENKYIKGSTLLVISCFFFIWRNNTLSLFSYIFPSSSHMLFSFSLGLIFWLSFLILGLKNNLKNNIAHLVPKGTPFYLISFIVLIEITRILIRPITLRVRLAANITAGHLLLSIISWSNNFLALTFLAQFLIFFLELIVSLIQAYVFSMLIILYLNENL